MGTFAGAMEGRNVPMEIKEALRNSVFLPVSIYRSETWIWSRAHQSRLSAVKN